MTGADVTLVALVVVLVVIAAAFASAEVALARVSRVRVEELVREHRRGARRLQQVLADPPRYLNLMLLLRLAAELVATAFVAKVCLDGIASDWLALLIAAGSMVVVSYVLIGVAPRTIGRQRAPMVALRAAGVAVVLTRLFGPLPRLLILLGNALTPGKGFREGPFASEAELRDLVDLAEEGKVIEHGERQMIHSVFELGDTVAREVMVPRTEMVFIERGKTVRQALSLALRSGFSRIPVIGDNEDDVLGVAYLKDLARRSQHIDGDKDHVEGVMRTATYVPDSKPLDELLREMQRDQVHLVIVIDEYGGTAGLVTIEDILEEIVGEINDEYDRELPPIEQLPNGAVRVTARLPVEDVNEICGVELPTDEAETVGGLLASVLGRVPIAGATITLEGLTFTAESGKGRRNRIATVLIAPGTGPQPTGDEVGSPVTAEA